MTAESFEIDEHTSHIAAANGSRPRAPGLNVVPATGSATLRDHQADVADAEFALVDTGYQGTSARLVRRGDKLKSVRPTPPGQCS